MSLKDEKKIYQTVSPHSDSPLIDRYIIRKISGFISWFLVKTPVTPNQVTITSMVTGIIAAVFFSHGTHINTIIAGVFYFISTVFDQCDGEVARSKRMESDFGRIFDIITDSIVNASIVIGITISIYKANGSGLSIVAGLLAMTGIVISLLLTTYFNSKNIKDTVAKEVLDKLNNKDFFYIIMLVSIIFNQMILFLLVMAIGTNIYWIAHKIAHRKIAT